MKRISILFLLFLSITQTFSANYTEGDYLYGQTSEGVKMGFIVIDPDAKTCKVASNHVLTNTSGEITIPRSVEGFTVIEISDYAFNGLKKITNINIPTSVKNIGNGAFSYCESLSSIIIPSNVTRLGESAFRSCKSLKTFSGGGGLTELEKFTFAQCESLVSIEIPSKVKVIGRYAFDGCKVLETFKGGQGLEDIGEYAFRNCESLKSISLPSNVKAIGNYAFYGCKVLETFKGGQGLEDIGEYAFLSCESLKSITLPENVKNVGRSAFSGCKTLEAITGGQNLESIEKYAFSGCESLKSISINVKTIGESAFYGCKMLESFTVGQGLEEIGQYAFNYCESLKTVSLPNTVKIIGNGAFSNCKELTTLTGIANVESITSSAFYIWSPWYESLPDGLIYIGKVAYKYKNTSSMPENATIDIKDGTTCITGYAFSGCSKMVAVTIPQSVREIGESPFSSCTNLSSITVASVNRVYDSRNDCNAVIHTASNVLISGCKETVIPNTVKAIGNSAFDGCTFNSVNIPDGVDSLANSAFWSCKELKEVTIGKGLRIIGSTPFANCSKLEDIVVSSTNPYFDSRNNCKGIVEKNTNTLVVGCMATVIPATVKEIGAYAFRSCTDNFYTFSIPNQINKIGYGAFNYNNKLRSVTIGSGVNEIESYAFCCNSLVAIHSLIESPFEIKENVFQHATFSTEDSIYNNAILYVPIGTRINYMSTPGWNKFKHIVETDGKSLCDGDVFTEESVEGQLLTFQVTSANAKTCELIASALNASGKITIPESPKGFSVTSIAERVFYERDVLSVVIPKTVTSIGEYSFYYCKKLESVNIPNGVKTIGQYAFFHCELLTIPELPSSLEVVGNRSFYYCKDLTISSLPQSLTMIGNDAFGYCKGTTTLIIPASVISIGRGAFEGWNDLTSISVDAGNSIYYSPSGSNAIIEKLSKTLIVGCKTTVIPNNVECIGKDAFYQMRELIEITIPNSVSIIDSLAFFNTGISNIVIPASVKSIAYRAFAYCDNLKTITSENKVPIGIPDDVFKSREDVIAPYTAATLYVPKGTKSLYQATDGWKLFQNIVEGSPETDPEPQNESVTTDGVTYLLNKETKTATVKTISARNTDLVIPASITYMGTSYSIVALGDSIFNNGIVGYNLYSVSIPSTITEVSERAFLKYGTSAVVWNSNTKIPSSSFTSSEYVNGNFILYVNRSDIAPSGVANVVVNGSAGEIVLKEGFEFNCPQEFTASKISYTHNYKMETGVGESAGWETIALPFDVTSVKHETKGELVPFASYTKGSNKKPFWLFYLSSSGFAEATAIKANTPYLISMPYNKSYSSDYNVGGKVTFSANNVTVHRTGDSFLNSSTYNGGTFVPGYSFYPSSYDLFTGDNNIYALNVSNDNTTYTGGEKPGSIFLNNYRSVYPFEGRIVKSSTRSDSFNIVFADNGEETGIQMLLQNGTNDNRQVRVYNLSGQLLYISDGDVITEQLAAGLYIINGKKVIVH